MDPKSVFTLVQIMYWSLIFNISNCLIFLSFLWQLTVVGPNGAAGVSALPRVVKVYTSAHGPVPSPNQRAEDNRVSGTTTCHRAVLRQRVQVSMTCFNRKKQLTEKVFATSVYSLTKSD